MNTAEEILLPLQRFQLTHDEVAHFDMLSFDLHKRLKHMVLHFFKYAGKIEAARPIGDVGEVRRILLDTFVICLATANALNLSLGEHIEVSTDASDLDGLASSLRHKSGDSDIFTDSIRHLVLIGGRMAKAVESLDHIERGDWRVEMEVQVPLLAAMVLALLGRVSGGLEDALRSRFKLIEQRSIFSRLSARSF
jgi:hypothetical protein